MRILFVSLFALGLLSCAHDPKSSSREPAGRVVAYEDASLRKGDLTVWKLQEMAENKEFDALNDLFNHGVSLDRLPVGYAAGTGARVLDLKTKTMTNVIDGLTGKNWRGKIFFRSQDPKKSHGLNRIKKFLTLPTAPIVPMAAFTTEILDRHEFVPEATSNVVILNYAHPKTKPYWHEIALTTVQVYDVMVAVPGKYGPVYVGKTWLGNYDKNDEFHAFNPGELIAWYFLDFSRAALEEQSRSHWDKSREDRIEF